MNDNWTDHIINLWVRVELNRGAPIELIISAEAILGFTFPVVRRRALYTSVSNNYFKNN
jgi:hypothetical protein